jgi:SAM-dependent MidA family methyltransferase
VDPAAPPPGQTVTPLGDLILRQIGQTGPMPLADYMALCLGHPDHGYYMRRDPLGSSGDFTTAPEISQMYGELLGLALAQAWLDRGAPAPFTLAELGPGRGTLMADALRAAARCPGFAGAARLHLVETSPALRQCQARTLAGHRPRWLDSAAALPDGPLFLIASEFFDALPIRQSVRVPGGWADRMVGIAAGRLAFGLGPPAADPVLDARHPGAAPGLVVESCPAAATALAPVRDRILAHGGAALVIDYGDWDGTGDTLQAVRHHAFADPLADPGAADLTAHVRFRDLAAAALPLAATFCTQGAFLRALGIAARAAALSRKGDAAAITGQMHRLTHPSEMGTVFKVLGLTRPGDPDLPAFPGDPDLPGFPGDPDLPGFPGDPTPPEPPA